MEPQFFEPRIIREHFGFIDLLGRRLREDAYGLEGTTIGAFTEQLPGLAPLFDSLVAASPTARNVTDRVIEDWNPIAQRILLSNETPASASSFETDFSLITAYAQSFIEWGHEAVHILAIEPWLCGRRKILSESEFVNWNLASEGLAFWYADIVITRLIRQIIPEAELVYVRQSVSNTCFHPEQAFRRLGYTDTDTILPLYISAFLGADVGLAQQGHPFSQVLAKRLREFYVGTSSTLASLYTMLDGYGVFDEFFARFCAVPGLPSLMDDDVLEVPWSLDEYHIRLGSNLLPRLANLPPERIRRVCARRHVQTRAYYAWMLRLALAKSWVFGNADFRIADLPDKIEAYLASLEDLLRTSVVAGEADTVVHRVAQLDQAFDAEVRGPLTRGEAHVKYRYRLYPYFAPTGGIMGIADQASGFSCDEMLEIVRFVMDRCEWDDSLIARLHAFLTLNSEGDATAARADFNDFMTHPFALQVWSVRLDSIDPVRNRFREILFDYT